MIEIAQDEFWLYFVLLILLAVVFLCSSMLYFDLREPKNPSGNEVDMDFIQSELNVKKAELRGKIK